MSDTPASARPPQVMVAVAAGAGASVAILITVGQVVSRLPTVEARETAAKFVSGSGGEWLTVDRALTLARVGLLVTGALAATMVVLAVFAARRDRRGQIGMSVVALPLALFSIFVDSFLIGFVVVSGLLLWTAPSRDWFAGRVPPPSAAPPTLVAPPPPPPLPMQHPTPFGAPPAPTSYVAVRSSPLTRPGRVVAACVITWVISSVVLLLSAVAAVSMTTADAHGDLTRLIADNQQLRDAHLSVATLSIYVLVLCGLLALWSLAAIVVAVLVFLGHGWARIALVFSAGLAGLGSLLCGLVSPGFLLVTMGCAAAVTLVVHRDSNTWFAALRNRPAPPPRPRVQPPSQPW
ncbi:MAG: hypothetical protein JWO46_2893 [Nocardioidaceae bacterium]|nr:hypothetical protein [Nocardioidaceae bacterium]